MWNAKVTEVKEEFGITKPTVEYSNGTVKNTFEETYQFTEVKGMADLKELVKKRIDELNNPPVVPEKIVVGDIDLTPAPTVIPDPLTPMEIKNSEYLNKLDDLKSKKQLVDLGVLETKDITLLQTEVKQLATDLGTI